MKTENTKEIIETLRTLVDVYVDESVASPIPWSGTLTDAEIKAIWTKLASLLKDQEVNKKKLPIGTAVIHCGRNRRILTEVYYIIKPDSDMVLCYPTSGFDKFCVNIKDLII
jgi:homospermidine synthase